MRNKIKILLEFDNYEFRRVKLMGENPVLYTKKEWVGKNVLIIPVPFDVTDRLIEAKWDAELHCHRIIIETYTILKKKVGNSRNIGRIYVPKDFIGLDCLIIEAPKLNNF